MEDWKKSLLDVAEKWEKKGFPSSNSAQHVDENGDFKRINKRPPQSTGRRRRQLRRREDNNWLKEDKITPTKFQLQAPVLKAPRQAYAAKSCMKCDNYIKNKDRNSGRETSMLFDILDVIGCSRRVSEVVDGSKGKEEKSSSFTQNALSIVASIHNKMAASFSNTFLRFAAWVLLKFFRKTFANICCQTQDFQAIKMATKKDVPIVYLPLHRSHLDYVIISFCLYCQNIRVPFTAAGDNLSGSSVFGFLLHKLGAFFIKRKISTEHNHLYNVVLQEYIEQLMQQKQSIQVFIEGTRSRTGKPCKPRTGILSILANAVIEGVVDDFIVVPVTISYDKIPESASYAMEQLGAQKIEENIWHLIQSLYRLFVSRNGKVHVRFGKPKSFETFCDTEQSFPHNENNSEILMKKQSSFMINKSTISTTRNLANHVIYDCYSNDVITSTSMVAFLMATKYRSGVAMEDLEDSFDRLKSEIENKNRYFGFIGLTRSVVHYAVDILLDQGLLQIALQKKPFDIYDGCFLTLCEETDKVLGLIFYSNQVSSLFFLEAIIASALIGLMGGVNLVRMKQTANDSISRDELLSLAKMLLNLLKREHLSIPPCRNLDDILSDEVDSFLAIGILDNAKGELDVISKNRYSYDWDIEDEDEDNYWRGVDIHYKVNTNDQNCSKLMHLNAIIAPYLEAYWFTASSLHGIIGVNNNIKDEELINAIHAVSLERVKKGLAEHVEIASLITIKNALTSLEDFGILKRGDNHNDDQNCDKPGLYVPSEFLQPESLSSYLSDINLCW
eukprot:gene5509-6194_t